MYEKAWSKNELGMPENSEKFCGAGAQSIHISGADRWEQSYRREGKRENKLDLY